MKKVVLVFLLVLAGSIAANAQGYFSAGINAGVLIPTGDLGNAYKTSFGFGAEGTYKINKDLDIVGNVIYNILTAKSAAWSDATVSITEGTAGVRYFFGSSQPKFFGEAALGFYSTAVSYSTTVLGSPIKFSASNSDFGINFGGGILAPLSPSLDFVGKLRYHNIFSSGSSTNFVTLSAGLDYKFK